MKAIVQGANALTKLVKQPNRAQNGSDDFARFNISVHKKIYCCKSMKTRDFLMNNEPPYLTVSFVIPQNCGITKASESHFAHDPPP